MQFHCSYSMLFTSVATPAVFAGILETRTRGINRQRNLSVLPPPMPLGFPFKATFFFPASFLPSFLSFFLSVSLPPFLPHTMHATYATYTSYTSAFDAVDFMFRQGHDWRLGRAGQSLLLRMRGTSLLARCWQQTYCQRAIHWRHGGTTSDFVYCVSLHIHSGSKFEVAPVTRLGCQ